ncbi:MAG: hypothetical protein DRG33_00085 [Deltaproteobacteria bacterium]|nr:MAG: hypothetical protein DRG33_00085 [Deltaproteobacteria bacterium]
MALNPSSGWQWYKELTISDPGNNSADYQIMLIVYAGEGTDDPSSGIIYCNNKCVNFPNDIRFGTTNDPLTATQLHQWIESYDSSKAIIWIKLPSDNTDTIYMFIGNYSANYYSDAQNVFSLFLDKDDEDNWITTIPVVVYAEGDELRIKQDPSSESGYAKREISVSETKYIFEQKIRILEPADATKKQCYYSLRDSSDNTGPAEWEGRDDNQDAFWYYDGNTAYVLYDPGSFDHKVIRRNVIDEENQKVDYYILDPDNYSILASATNKAFVSSSFSSLHHLMISDGTSYQGSFHIGITWIRIRKYADPAPTWSSFRTWKHVGISPNTGWSYVKTLTVSDPDNQSDNYQLRLIVYAGDGSDVPADGIVYCNNKCEAFPSDIRFGTTSNPGTAIQLPHWIEDYDANQAVIWVKLPPDNADKIYMFIGNSKASFYSNGSETFLFYSDKEDVDNWVTSGPVTVSAEADELRVYHEPSTSTGYAMRYFSISVQKYVFEQKIRILDPGDADVKQCWYYLRDSEGDIGPSEYEGKDENPHAFWCFDGWSSILLYDPGDFDYTVIRSDIVNEIEDKVDYFVLDPSDYSVLGYASDCSFPSSGYANPDRIFIGTGVSGEYAGFDIRISWIRIRKYADTEPSWASFSSWESIQGLIPNTGWSWVKELQISDPENQSSDYQIKLTVYRGTGSDDPTQGVVYCDDKCEDFPYDIRFGTENNPLTATQLAQWIEEWDNDHAIIWVRLPSDNSDVIYMFVGNSSAGQYKDGDATFLFFDDFEGTSLDTSKWVEVTGVNTQVSDSILELWEDSSNHDAIRSIDFFSYPKALRALAKMGSGVGSQVGFSNMYDSGNDDLKINSQDGYSTYTFYCRKDGTSTAYSTGKTKDDEWHIIDIYWTGGTATSKLLIDGGYETTVSASYDPTDDQKVLLRQYNAPNRLYVDWIFVRKYADPEPTWAVFSAWEEPTSFISISYSFDALLQLLPIQKTILFDSRLSKTVYKNFSFDALILNSKSLSFDSLLKKKAGESYRFDAEIYYRQLKDLVFSALLKATFERSSSVTSHLARTLYLSHIISTRIGKTLAKSHSISSLLDRRYTLNTSFSVYLKQLKPNLSIKFKNGDATYVKCSRWDEDNWNVMIEFIAGKSERDAILSNITPGAVAELYNILGEPKFIDTTYCSGNTLWIEPVAGWNLAQLRDPIKIGVKRYSETMLRWDTFKIKIEGVKL